MLNVLEMLEITVSVLCLVNARGFDCALQNKTKNRDARLDMNRNNKF
jgi:hypothetical protein